MKNLSIFEPQIEKHYAYKKKTCIPLFSRTEDHFQKSDRSAFMQTFRKNYKMAHWKPATSSVPWLHAKNRNNYDQGKLDPARGMSISIDVIRKQLTVTYLFSRNSLSSWGYSLLCSSFCWTPVPGSFTFDESFQTQQFLVVLGLLHLNMLESESNIENASKYTLREYLQWTFTKFSSRERQNE